MVGVGVGGMDEDSPIPYAQLCHLRLREHLDVNNSRPSNAHVRRIDFIQKLKKNIPWLSSYGTFLLVL